MIELKYKLPKEPEIVARIICSVPDEWTWYGYLLATKQHYDTGQVACSTVMSIMKEKVYLVGRRVQDYEEWVSSVPDHLDLGPDLVALAQGKLPAKISIHNLRTSIHEDRVIAGDVRDLLSEYLRKGYKGTLKAIATVPFAEPEGWPPGTSVIVDHYHNEATFLITELKGKTLLERFQHIGLEQL